MIPVHRVRRVHRVNPERPAGSKAHPVLWVHKAPQDHKAHRDQRALLVPQVPLVPLVHKAHKANPEIPDHKDRPAQRLQVVLLEILS